MTENKEAPQKHTERQLERDKDVLAVLNRHADGLTVWQARATLKFNCAATLDKLVKRGHVTKHSNGKKGSSQYIYKAAIDTPTIKTEKNITEKNITPTFTPTAQTAIDSVSAIIDENIRLKATLKELHSYIGKLL